MSDEKFQRFCIHRPCPKCGSGPTPSTYCGVTMPGIGMYDRNLFHPFVPEGGHLHRKCLHCGHERIEIAKDEPLLAPSSREAARDRLLQEWTERRDRIAAASKGLFA